jgi:hypothetical protein
VKADLFGGQGWHGNKSFLVPAGATLFAAAIEFVHGRPGAGFRIFHADTFFLVAGFDVCRLTFLFVSVTGFIALRHGVASRGFDHFLPAGFIAGGTFMSNAALKSISCSCSCTMMARKVSLNANSPIASAWRMRSR